MTPHRLATTDHLVLTGSSGRKTLDRNHVKPVSTLTPLSGKKRAFPIDKASPKEAQANDRTIKKRRLLGTPSTRVPAHMFDDFD
jgi:hypothetical protein